MEMKRALAATAGTVLAFTMMATGPAFADDRHHAEHHKNAHGSEETRCGGNRTSGQDREWLKSSIEGDHFEITGGRLAQQRGVDPMTKALGARLERDHTKSLADAVALASALGIKPPTAMSDKQREELSQVSEQRGLHFDDAYAELEVQDHKMDIHEAQNEWENGCNQMVRDEANTELPVLRQHLQLSDQTSRHIETLANHESGGRDGSSNEG
jgi:predicted outer membrane protein